MMKLNQLASKLTKNEDDQPVIAVQGTEHQILIRKQPSTITAIYKDL